MTSFSTNLSPSYSETTLPAFVKFDGKVEEDSSQQKFESFQALVSLDSKVTTHQKLILQASREKWLSLAKSVGAIALTTLFCIGFAALFFHVGLVVTPAAFALLNGILIVGLVVDAVTEWKRNAARQKELKKDLEDSVQRKSNYDDHLKSDLDLVLASTTSKTPFTAQHRVG